MAVRVEVAPASAQQPRWGAWFGHPLGCCTFASVTPEEPEAREELESHMRKMKDVDVTCPTLSTFADTVAGSPMSVSSKRSDSMPTLLGVCRVSSKASSASRRTFREGLSVPRFVRTPSFEVDYSELPELSIPEDEEPLVGGHLDVRFADMAATMFREEDSPFSSFLCGVMGCFDMCASPFDEEWPGSADTMLQRSVYQLPLPADIPELVAVLLGLGKSVKSTTFTRAERGPGLITLQQISHTEGLLYSERMRVMNTHCLEEDPAGGVSWRTFTRIVWMKPLPWTHSFIVKFIDSRVRGETKINAPLLMGCIQEAAAVANPQI